MTSSDEVPEEFRAAVRAAAAAVGWTVQGEDEDGLECANAAGEPHSIGLPRLYKRFRDKPAAEWAGLVEDHFRTVIALTEARASDDLNARADRILARVGPPYPAMPPVLVWSRPIPGTPLAVMLVLEEGPGLRFVRTDMVEESGRPGDDWCAVGLANLRQRTPAGSLRVVEPESGMLACCVGDSHDASRSLFVEEMLAEPVPHGLLLSVPRRDLLLALPVTRSSLTQRAVALLKALTQSQHDEASHPISPEVFWVRGGVWQPVGIELSESGVRLHPPTELGDILRTLAAEE